ncbi:hypothetical protein GGTG_05512 [Gaeumannomyces tritici R3-111a-1]|uniref:Uncharacterized protein n=1 Tax=Gaeumannomyces tritici (strain R3-111a-1) TaxID=644352 RepID=J3NW47_GAET3|nr:hypothetical protein GGTG_05512 [Gaeumannomyces tritici R3-111a-1]EJT75579.1 hypothetical protein GGTG_05512 [Gaeumannomyces tritici R3-111a-1]
MLRRVVGPESGLSDRWASRKSRDTAVPSWSRTEGVQRREGSVAQERSALRAARSGTEAGIEAGMGALRGVGPAVGMQSEKPDGVNGHAPELEVSQEAETLGRTWKGTVLSAPTWKFGTKSCNEAQDLGRMESVG